MPSEVAYPADPAVSLRVGNGLARRGKIEGGLITASFR